jgi:MFS family permease
MILPILVTTTFSTSYILMLSGGNMTGRIFWGLISDKIGRKAMFNIFTFGSIPLYATLPFFIASVVSNPSSLPLWGFIGSTVVIISVLGGTYSCMPAYEADLFGSKYLGANHGKMLLGNSVAAIVGPNIIIILRKHSELIAIKDLLMKADPAKF